jgi:hypothetical protein
MGDIIEITTKLGIEKACLQENKQKFQQTQNTPCMQEPLCSELGKFGDSASSRAILLGEYEPPPSTSVYTRELLLQLKHTKYDRASIPQATISTDTFKSGWKKMNEFTSAGI